MYPTGIKPTRLSHFVMTLTVALAVLLAPQPAAGQVSDQVTGSVTSANAQFVVASYSELLGRSAETAGLDFHLGQIAAGGSKSRHVMAYGLLFSAEGSRQEVARAYDDLLHRTPDPAGADYWTNHLGGRGVLDLRVLLIAADEYHLQAGGSDTTWLNRVYADVLGRSPDAAGRAYWLGLGDLGVARASIAGAIYRSDEALGQRVDAYYLDVLNRAPSSAERDGAIGAVRVHGERYLRAQLWASDEAFETYLAGAWS